MDVKTITKQQQIRDIIYNRIASGEYRENEQISSIRDIVKEFKVSKHTASQAIAMLMSEGILTRDQGRGTFVAPREMRSLNPRSIAVLLVGTSGHLYQDLSKILIQGVQEHDFQTMVIDIGPLRRQFEGERLVSLVRKLIEMNPGLLIVEGGILNHLGFVHEIVKPDQKLAIILNHHPDYADKALQVVTNYRHGVSLGIKHLLEKGHRRILFIPGSPMFFKSNQELVRGIKKIFSEYQVEWSDEFCFERDGKCRETNIKRLRELFTGSNRPTAVFAVGDFLATSEVYPAAKQAELKIPEDLAVVGYFNTPWAEVVDPPLTSISIREEEIAQLTLDTLFSEKFNPRKGKKIVVKPELIARKST